MAKVVTSAQQKAGRTITARITGRADMGQKARICGSLAVMGVAPPMSSVIVEKHHPVSQVSQNYACKSILITTHLVVKKSDHCKEILDKAQI